MPAVLLLNTFTVKLSEDEARAVWRALGNINDAVLDKAKVSKGDQKVLEELWDALDTAITK